MSSLSSKAHLKLVPTGEDCRAPEWGAPHHHTRETASREYSELKAILLEPIEGRDSDPVAQQVAALFRFSEKLMQMLNDERSLAIEAEHIRRQRLATKDEILERIVGSIDEDVPTEHLDMTAEDFDSIADLCDD